MPARKIGNVQTAKTYAKQAYTHPYEFSAMLLLITSSITWVYEALNIVITGVKAIWPVILFVPVACFLVFKLLQIETRRQRFLDMLTTAQQFDFKFVKRIESKQMLQIVSGAAVTRGNVSNTVYYRNESIIFTDSFCISNDILYYSDKLPDEIKYANFIKKIA